MKTILFSNVVGDVFDQKGKVAFLPKLEEIVLSWGLEKAEIVYVDAPMDGYDNLVVFENIKKCFSRFLDFDKMIFVGKESGSVQIKDENNCIFFLTGGNPLTQKEIIKQHNLEEKIRKAKFCIGFCAGAINLSKHGIITSDDDFETPFVYDALARVDISIEPHFNHKKQQIEQPKEFERRLEELKGFVKKIGEPIYAVPDASLIYVEDGKVFEFGEIVKFAVGGER